MKNTWEFEGEVVRMKEYDTSRFTHNLTIRGMYEGNENSANCIVEFGCMVPKTVKARGIKLYGKVSCKGHFETWTHVSQSGNLKQQRSCIVDEIEVERENIFTFIRR